MARRLSNKLVAKGDDDQQTGKHSDANGLYLLVNPNGSRPWV
jgi:hypothetical protein